MKRLNTVFSGLIILSMLASCKADMICPAYQSYFLLDSATQVSQFTYFAEDSFPRRDLFNSKKDKNGLMVYEEYRQRWLDHKTVPMEVVYPVPSDSTLFAGDVMMYAETDVIDSAALDSARMAANTFQYNVDQKYYNWYFRGKLSWADEADKDKAKEKEPPRPQPAKQASQLAEPDTTRQKFGVKNLFQKKEKPPKAPKSKGKDNNLTPPITPKDSIQGQDDGTNDF